MSERQAMITDPLALRRQASEIRKRNLRLIVEAGAGHTGGDLSAADILTVLYFGGVLRVDPAVPGAPTRDRFFLSKGHASGLLYTTLALAGFFPEAELHTFMQPHARLSGHPSVRVPGVEANTGALGHGLPIATGAALAAKLDNAPWRAFVLTGDGELQEGSNWEAALIAAHQRLDTLVCIVDRNHIQMMDRTERIARLDPLADKWRAFGWAVREVDGHDHAALLEALHAVPFEPGRPSCLIANTRKGRGVSFIEDRIDWHHRVPTPEQLAAALAELDAACPPPGTQAHGSTASAPPLAPRGEEPGTEAPPAPSLPLARARSTEASALYDCRDAFVATLEALAERDPRVVVLCNDSISSTKLTAFAARFPDRLVNIGISEQAMVGAGAGLAIGGRLPFVAGAGAFLTGRALEQIKNDLAYTHTNVKLYAVSTGLAYGALGATHHAIEDLAWLRAIAGMTVIVPADPLETAQALEAAAALDGPVYLRISRMGVPAVHDVAYRFAIGRAACLRQGHDITLIACGTLVCRALAAADLLAAHGIAARVLNMATIRPLDRDAVLAAVAETRAIVTAEEHTVYGGLGGAVAEVVAQAPRPIPMRILGVPGTFAPTGSTEFLFEHFGLTPGCIAGAALELLQ